MANIGYIQVNRHCNNACHFCSNPSNGNNITYEKWVEIIDDFIKRQYKWVIFTGWEPTLSPDLPRWITYAKEAWIESRIISNGMMCANFAYMEKLAKAWLELVHFSVYSYNPKIHDFLTDTPGSWKRLMLSIRNAISLGVRVQINSAINHYNQNHLDVTVKFLVKQFPQIQHFVWNNLDPFMMRKTDTALSTLPNFDVLETPLFHAMTYLKNTGRTFRVERLPLCYMRWFEEYSTETRKIVKREERVVHFLDEREVVEQKADRFYHDKWEECKSCDLNEICAWVWLAYPTTVFGVEHPGYYHYVRFKEQKISKEELSRIIHTIKSENV
jgi:MoaA/NifB/PqqE/SkfB family radical SAM enzyme